MPSPRSLFDVWSLYQQEVRASQPEQQANATLAQTKTALLRYTLPGWSFPIPKGNKLTNREIEVALNYTKQVSLEQLFEAQDIQQQVFEELEVPSNSQRNYRAALNKLLVWCQQQSWWSTSVSSDRASSQASEQRKQAAHVRVTNRKYKDEQGNLIQEYRYGLGAVEADVIPKHLGDELDAFKRFRKRFVRQSTLDKDLKHIRLILGWLYRIKKVPLEELSLKKIVPIVPLSSEQGEGVELIHKEAVEQTCELADDYIKWLKASPEAERPEDRGRGIESVHTEVSIFKTFLVVSEFIYREEYRVEIAQYEALPVVQALRKKLIEAQQRSENDESVIERPEKILEWLDFLGFVETLRQECRACEKSRLQFKERQKKFNSMRSLSAIANSYQCFLLAALLAYIPPQRQQVYRNLHIPYPGAVRPNFGHRSQQYWQRDNFNLDFFNQDRMSEERNEEPLNILEISSYLYKESNVWYIQLLPDNYKTSKRYSDLSIMIPNIQYKDGRFFYQYIEEWLFEYNYQPHNKAYETIEGLRQVFSPQHDYFFTQKNGTRYSHSTNFSNLLRNQTYRITGKVLTPQSIRYMFAKYVLTQTDWDTTIQPLAEELKSYYRYYGINYDLWLYERTVDVGCQVAKEIVNYVRNQE